MVQGLGVWLKNAGPMAASLKISDWIFFYLVQLEKEDRSRVMLEITLEEWKVRLLHVASGICLWDNKLK